MTYFVSIQSLCATDGDSAGNLLYNHLVEHPNSNAIVIPPIKVKSFNELNMAFEWVNSSIASDNNVVICIDAHSDSDGTVLNESSLSRNLCD